MGKGNNTGRQAAMDTYMIQLEASSGRHWISSRAGQQLDITLIEKQESMEAAVALLRNQPIVALDFETTTERGSYEKYVDTKGVEHEYGPQGEHSGDIRLIQVGYTDPSGRGRQVLFDGQKVDLTPLAELLEDPTVSKIVHYCPFELAWSRHKLGCDIEGLQDTCFTAQSVNKEIRSRIATGLMPKADKKQLAELTNLLRLPSEGGVRALQDESASFTDQQVLKATKKTVAKIQKELDDLGCADTSAALQDWQSTEKAALKDLSARYLQAPMSKEEQASDWSRKRLSAEQLDYAAADAAVTLQVQRHMENLSSLLGLQAQVQWRLDKERKNHQPAAS